MQVIDVKRQIHDNQLDHFYVFTGVEIEAQRIYIHKISEVTGKPIIRIEQVKEALNKRASLFKTSNLFVCRDDSEFWKTATSAESVIDMLGDNILILQMTDIDKRSRASKEYADLTVEFEYMDADVLYKYVQRKCRLTDDRTYDLIDRCEQDYSRILLEIDKIDNARTGDTSVNEVYDKLVADGTISKPPKDVIFDYVNAFLRADIESAFRLLEECKAYGESAIKVLSVLYTNIKRVFQVQICDSDDICRTTGLTAWEVKLAKQTAGCWKSEDLFYFLKAIYQVEQGVKTGIVDEEFALDFLMVLVL